MKLRNSYVQPDTNRYYAKRILENHVSRHGLPETVTDSHIYTFNGLVGEYLECMKQMWEAVDDEKTISKFNQCFCDKMIIADEIFELLKEMGINVPQQRHKIWGEIENLWSTLSEYRNNQVYGNGCGIGRGY